VYVFRKKIRWNRVDVLKLKTDNTLPNITGGYITKQDKTTGSDP
jgi:hypothetical protein